MMLKILNPLSKTLKIPDVIASWHISSAVQLVEVQSPKLLQPAPPCPPPNRQSNDKLPLLCSRKNPSGQPLLPMCSNGGRVISGVVDCIVECVVVGAAVVVIGTGMQISLPQ